MVIGTQTWMAENLNYAPSSGSSYCLGDDPSNCATYGRLYDYATAMTACPTGWHLPDTTEWKTLFTAAGYPAGTKLKANSSLWLTNTGTDYLGFSVLPGSFYGLLAADFGKYADFWTSDVKDAYDWYYVYFGYTYATPGISFFGHPSSVRCVMD